MTGQIMSSLYSGHFILYFIPCILMCVLGLELGYIFLWLCYSTMLSYNLYRVLPCLWYVRGFGVLP